MIKIQHRNSPDFPAQSYAMILGLFAFFTLSTPILAQEKNGREGKVIPTGEIIGKVVDAISGEPLEYTNVALYNLPDSQLVTGGITSPNGEFQLTKIPSGKFYISINFIGYRTYQSEVISVSKTTTFLDMGKIPLEMKTEVLKAIEITAEKEGIEYKIDKKVVNVEKFYTATSGTAVDVLENVPSVSVDAERNVSIRGSSGFTVLVDGRPTVMDAADVLEQYPASAIEKLEIITNPSAKYDPEGTTGIINIVTKKQKQEGISGIANVNIGMYENYGGDFLVQVREKKSTWYVGADYNHRNRLGNQETYNATLFSDTIKVVGGEGEFSSPRQSASLRAGIDFKLTNKNFLLVEGSVQKSDRIRYSAVDFIESNNDIVVDRYDSENESSRLSSNWNINTDFAHKFSGEDHKLSVQLSYGEIQGDEYSLNELFDPVLMSLSSGIRNTEVGPNKKGQTRLNYERKVSDSLKYEIGYQGTLDSSSDDFGTTNYSLSSNEYEVDSAATRSSTFFRYIHAPYALVAGSKRKWGYQFALRTEFTNRNVTVLGNPTNFEINRVDFFPTIHFSYDFPKKHQLMWSYSRRIQRPRPWNLEPYVVARNQWTYRSGNPNLAPEYIDAFEIGYQKRFGNLFFSAETYLRITHDKVESIQQAYVEKGPGVTLQIPENVGSDQALGLEIMIKTPLAKWWELNVMGNLYDYRVYGDYVDVVNQKTYNFDNSSTNYTVRVNQTFSVLSNTKIQFNSSYNSPTVSAQGTSAGFFNFNSSIRMDVIPGRLALNLQGQNIFNTVFHESTVSGPGLETRSYMKMVGPVFIFTATYKLNNYVPKKSREGNGSGGDMED